MATLTVQHSLDTSTALIAHLLENLKETSLPKSTNDHRPINPLALSSTAASLIKAQTTKLTLLALNKPFTPSPIIQVLSTISTSPLPALVTGVQICDPAKFSCFAQHELRNKASRLLKAYETLLTKIPPSEEAQESSILASGMPNLGDSSELNQKAALIGTGLVWEVCDEIIAFSEQGLSETSAKKMAGYRALFNDALEEIDEWLEEGKIHDDLQDELEDLSLGDASSDSASVESFSSRPTKETIPVADWTLTILNHLTLLYPPLIKRRIKKFPELNHKTSMDAVPSKDVARLDQILDAGKFWSEQIDMVAEALFENEGDQAMERVSQLLQSIDLCIDSVRQTWNGSEDEFTKWLIQWSSKLVEVRTKGRPQYDER